MENYDFADAQQRKKAYEYEPIPVKPENFELSPGGTRLLKYIGTDEKVVVPPSVTVIEPRAFEKNKTIKYVSMMNVEEIGLGAFSGCKNLEFVSLGQNLKVLSFGAFSNCEKLDLVKLPKTVHTINDGALRNIGYVSIEKGSKYVSYDDGAFIIDQSCSRLLHVSNRITGEFSIPNFVKIIGEYALEGCVGITSLNLANGLREIETRAFALTKLAFIPFPNTLVKIQTRAFEDSNIETLYLPESVREVGSKILFNAPVKKVTVSQTEGDIKNLVGFKYAPDWNNIGKAGTAKTIYGVRPGEGQFVINNGVLESVKYVDGGVVVVPEGVKKLYNNFLSGHTEDVKKVILPEGLIEIGIEAFRSCNKLETINFPQSLRYIGIQAFDNCVSLKCEIDLPKKLEFIGASAFNWCVELPKIIIHAGIITVEPHAFYGDNKCTIVLDGVKKSLFGSEPKGFKKGWDDGWEREKLLVWNR